MSAKNGLSRLFANISYPNIFLRELAQITETRVLGRAIGPLLSPYRSGNVVMFHVGRSGSTVLADLLVQHGSVFWDGEVYDREFKAWEKKGRAIGKEAAAFDPLEMIRTRMARAGRHLYGFEVKPFHLKLANISMADYVQGLEELGINYYILLERKNLLRKVVSSLVRKQKGQSHQSYKQKASITRVNVNINNVKIDRAAKPLIVFLQEYEEHMRILAELLKGRNVLHLTFEDDVSEGPVTGYRRICKFLGIEEHQALQRYGKTNPFKLTEIVRNFDEVERSLRGTSYEWMLYE